MKIGKTIKRLREAQEFTQVDLANSCGISVVFLSMIENDKKKPSDEILSKIAEALNSNSEAVIILSMDEESLVKSAKKPELIPLMKSTKKLLENLYFGNNETI